MSAGPVRVVLLLPDVLGTYGDSGNAEVLATRLRWHGRDAVVHPVGWDAAVPADGDVYVVGGGEDAAQVLAARHLAGPAGRGLRAAVARGAPVLAVCAGLQILGTRFTTADGVTADGLGLLDLVTGPGGGPRHIGDVVADPLVPGLVAPLRGFENHGGRTRLGPGAAPLARVRPGSGAGNGGGAGGGPGAGSGGRDEGAVAGHVVGTYLHGPVLARNPALADLLLGWAVGDGVGPLRAPVAPSGVPAATARRLGTAP